jgi:hypothetical protein
MNKDLVNLDLPASQTPPDHFIYHIMRIKVAAANIILQGVMGRESALFILVDKKTRPSWESVPEPPELKVFCKLG